MSYDKPYVEFFNGHQMPIIGIGTWTSTPEEIKVAIKTALNVGYRHIDTAFLYLNEKAIGETLKEIFAVGKIKREDLFIVTKLPSIGMRACDVEHFLQLSLSDLQLHYVDLYLVHTCFGMQNVGDSNLLPKDKDGKSLLDMTTDLEAIWKAMEEMVDLGLTKSIGVSNWSTNQLQRILNICRIKPANIQVECHAYFQQNKLIDFCNKNGITVCAYSPIGTPGMPAAIEKLGGAKVNEIPHLLSDPLIVELAGKYNKNAAQILLRFLMQRGIAVIPKSATPKRIETNFNVSDFNLEPSDMNAITKIDRNQRFFDMSFIAGVENHPEFEGYA